LRVKYISHSYYSLSWAQCNLLTSTANSSNKNNTNYILLSSFKNDTTKKKLCFQKEEKFLELFFELLTNQIILAKNIFNIIKCYFCSPPPPPPHFGFKILKKNHSFWVVTIFFKLLFSNCDASENDNFDDFFHKIS